MYGSLQNSMLSTMQNTPAPVIGMSATELWYTDRLAYTITRVSKSGKTFWMKHLDACSGNFKVRVYFSKPKGKWVSQGGRTVLVGVHDSYTDPTF
jgi:hypothetical protein